MADIFEVLEHGSIVAGDPETGLIVTTTGAMMRVWAFEDGEWVEAGDQRASGTLRTVTLYDAALNADALLREFEDDGEDDETEEEEEPRGRW